MPATSPAFALSSHTLISPTTDTKVVYRRYASLFFIAATDNTDNELITLEIVHRYVEQMDKYYGNVCELDIIFNFQKAYFILDELLIAGEMQESSKKNVLRVIGAQDSLEDMEVSCCVFFACALSTHTRCTLRAHFPSPLADALLYRSRMKLSQELADAPPLRLPRHASHCVKQRHRSLTAHFALQDQVESNSELEKSLREAGFL